MSYRRTPRASFLPESLEPRSLCSATAPSPFEQYLLELINRARANPAAEGWRHGISVNEGLAPGTINNTPRQPLAFNPYLADASAQHAAYLLAHDLFTHTGDGGTTPGQRMTSAGYTPTHWAENLAWFGRATETPAPAATVKDLHRRLFVDKDIAGRGHRLNLLNANFSEVGLSVAAGTYQTFNSVLLNTNFATRGGVFLTGVAYSDTVRDHFYTPGEGLGGVTVTATRASDGQVFTTSTWASGGYSLALPAGTYTVDAAGGGLALSSTVTIASQNVKLDFTPQPDPQPDVTQPRAALKSRQHHRKSMLFEVVYRDDREMDLASLGRGDLKVVSVKGWSRRARLISANTSKDGQAIRAVYRLRAPGTGWDPADNGRYTVRVNRQQVQDTSGNVARSRKIGGFGVKLDRPLFSVRRLVAAGLPIW